MNILFLYWGKRGGGARYSLELTRALAELPGVQINLSVSNQCEILSEFKALGLPTHYVDTYQNVFGFLKKFTLDRARLQKNLEDYLRKYRVRCSGFMKSKMMESNEIPGLSKPRPFRSNFYS